MNGASRLFCGLVRCFDLTGDARAIEAAVGVAQRRLSIKNARVSRRKGSAVSDNSWSVDRVESNSQVLPPSVERQKATMSYFASGVRP